ncbi:MAG: ABC transporter permease [Puniceicoccales bacterium]|nr:ABC transporter permease [Puniceicoccales bacterium]
MKKFYAVFKYEIHKLIVSPSTYAIALIFAISVGAIFMLLLRDYTINAQMVPFAQMFFRCFFLPTFIAVPLISMRSFSEEYKSGTFHTLFSVAISHGTVVLAKFFATYLIFLAIWLSSLWLFAAVGVGAGAVFGEVAFAARFNILGGMLCIAVVGTFFVAVGILASSLTDNQIMACTMTFFLLVAFLIGGQALADGIGAGSLGLFGSYAESLKVFAQVDNFCNGVVDSRPIVFYLSSSALTLCASTIAVQKKTG